jgi:hypothetical protein
MKLKFDNVPKIARKLEESYIRQNELLYGMEDHLQAIMPSHNIAFDLPDPHIWDPAASLHLNDGVEQLINREREFQNYMASFNADPQFLPNLDIVYAPCVSAFKAFQRIEDLVPMIDFPENILSDIFSFHAAIDDSEIPNQFVQEMFDVSEESAEVIRAVVSGAVKTKEDNAPHSEPSSVETPDITPHNASNKKLIIDKVKVGFEVAAAIATILGFFQNCTSNCNSQYTTPFPKDSVIQRLSNTAEDLSSQLNLVNGTDC